MLCSPNGVFTVFRCVTISSNSSVSLSHIALSLGSTCHILQVEKLSIHLTDLCRLSRNYICGSTCQTLPGSRSSPQPATICMVDGQFSDHQSLFFKFCPQPGDGCRLTDNFRTPPDVAVLNLVDLCRLTDNYDFVTQT